MIKIYPSLKKMMVGLVISFVFTIVGVIEIIGGMDGNILLLILGVVSAGFMGIVFLYLLKRIIMRTPILVIDKDGITDNASAGGVGLVRWSEVKEVIIHTYMDQKLLGIVVHNNDVIEERLSGIKKALFKINKSKAMSMNTPINIPQNVTSVKLEEIKKHIDDMLNNNW